MSEQKQVSPLLDGFTVGNPMSDHDGVCCCPAIKENTDIKYIVKIISVPATQKQMDALLLAGAYKDAAGAMDYYKDQSEEIAAEVELLQKLSQQEGFLPYEGCQIEPITKRRLGYEVYLLSRYKRSLEKYLKRNPVTHLEAFNMSIDICGALSICRDAGFIYVDLKPSNIFMSEQKEYRIGDLGFLSLDALNYTTLPNKYRSAYTPPEFDDPMAPLNTTADTYALGMILYQLYNDSQVPSRDDILHGAVPSPLNADYELAEIIMTAIHPDPLQRWLDPAAMKQALISYMQKNAVNDTPITHHIPLELSADIPVSQEENSVNSVQNEEEPKESTTDTSESESSDSNEHDGIEQSSDSTLPDEEDADLLQPHEMSDEISRMVAKADDLIAHETPAGVVVPEAPELPDPFAFAAEDSDDLDDSDIPLDPVMEDETDQTVVTGKKKKSARFVSPVRKQKAKKLLTTLLFLAASAAVALCCFLYYQLFYLIPVDSMVIQGNDHQISVEIRTIADEHKLKVLCSDQYGNVHSSHVTDGTATFEGLLSDTTYTIDVKYDGFHKMVGEASGFFTTDANTHIVSFTAVNGPEDGSFVFNFTVDGEEPDRWTIVCSAEGEAERRESFSGHSVTVKHLTIGKRYTFTLVPGNKLAANGMTSIECLASRLILAENITVSTENGNDMTIRWKSPGDVVVESWDVRCYNASHYDAQFTVQKPEITIPNIDLNQGYHIEITAAGMTQPARTSITKKPIVINQFTVTAEEDSLEKMTLNWEFTGDTPKNGWLLMYTVDGGITPTIVQCKSPSAVISPRIPGAKYRFTLQSANSTSIINSVHSYESSDVGVFQEHGLSTDTVTVKLLKTPELKNWKYETISNTDFTDTFSVDDKISVVLQAESPFYMPGNETHIAYVYRDPHGNVYSAASAPGKTYWKSIWSSGDAKTGELDVPITPDLPGSYVLEIYVDGMVLAKIPITVQ